MLGQITDGKAAWSDFVSGVQQTFADNAASLPALLIAVAVLELIWADYRIAKWIVKRMGKNQGQRSAKR